MGGAVYLVVTIAASIGAFIGFDIAFRLYVWRLRRIAREEIIEFAVMRSGLTRNNEDRIRKSIKDDWDRFRTSSSRRGKSDA